MNYGCFKEGIESGYSTLFAKQAPANTRLRVRRPLLPLMKRVLRDKTSGLYVGSHSKKSCQLQLLEHAYYFQTDEEAEDAKENLQDRCGLDLEIVWETVD